MAVERLGEVDLHSRLGEEFLSCKICFEKFTEPKTLPCLHTFCRQCLDRYAVSASTVTPDLGLKFPCPMCRKDTPVPAGGIAALPTNFMLSNLDEALTETAPSHLCNNCFEESKSVDAVVYCEDCKDYLCPECESAHGKTKLTRSHSVIPVKRQAKLKVPSTPPASFTETPLKQMESTFSKHQGDLDQVLSMPCSTHIQKTVMSCCMTCLEPLCPDCMMEIMNKPNSRHKNHKVGDLKDAMKSTAQDSEDNMDKIKDDIERWGGALEEGDRCNERLEMQKNQLAEELENRCKYLISAANQWKETALKQVEMGHKIEANKVKVHQQRVKSKQGELTKLHLSVKDMTKRLWSGDVTALADLKKLDVAGKLNRYDPLKRDKNELDLDEYQLGGHQCLSEEASLYGSNTDQELQLLNHFGKIDKIESDESSELARADSEASLVSEPDMEKGPEAPPRIRCKIKQVNSFRVHKAKVVGMDIGLRDEFIIVNGESNEILVFGENCKIQRKFGKGQKKDTQNLSYALDAAVCPDGNIAVSDGLTGHCIKIYDAEGNFKASFGHAYMKKAAGVAVNSMGQIIVTDVDAQKVYIHGATPQRKLIKTLFTSKVKDKVHKQFKSPEFVAVSSVDDDFIVCDAQWSNVKIFNKEGNFRAKFGHTPGKGHRQMMNPAGVCVDRQGNVFIADTGNQRIQVVSKSGKQICHIPVQAMGKFAPPPGILAINRKGQLVAANEPGFVKIFEYSFS